MLSGRASLTVNVCSLGHIKNCNNMRLPTFFPLKTLVFSESAAATMAKFKMLLA